MNKKEEEQRDQETPPPPRDNQGRFTPPPPPEEPEKPKAPDFLGSAIDNTLALLREKGRIFNKKVDFEGMDDGQIFRFLDNQRKQMDASPKKKPKKKPTANNPIVPVPTGGKPTHWTDEYLKIDPNRREIEFIVPMSELLQKYKNNKKTTIINW